MTGPEDDIWTQAVDDARWAPSSHNTQPWAFRRTADGLEVLADASRALTEIDPDFRELVISGGAAVHHLRVALRGRGHAVKVEALPDGADDAVLARLRLAGEVKPRPEDERMLKAIHERHTDRGRYADERLPNAPLDDLRTLAADEGATFTVISDPEQRAELGRIVEEADRGQQRWPVVKEVLAWTRLPGRHQDDGLPASATLRGAHDRAARERALVEAGPVLAVVSTSHDEPPHWLAAGQALSAIALGATARGLSVSFYDAPVEDPTLRGQVARAAGVEGHPQLLLRLGHGEGAAASPRRSLDDVLEADGEG
jgi:nitroreductase